MISSIFREAMYLDLPSYVILNYRKRIDTVFVTVFGIVHLLKGILTCTNIDIMK